MGDVVREILLCLLIAAMLGVAIGWFARGVRARRASASGARDFQRTLGEARAQLLAMETARTEEQRRLAGLQTAADRAHQEAEARRGELHETRLGRDAARQETSLARDEALKLSSQLKEAESARDAAHVGAESSQAARLEAETRLKESESARAALQLQVEHFTAARPPSATGEATRQHLDTLRATLQAAEAGWDSARGQAEAAAKQLSATRRQLTESEMDRQALATRLTEAQSLLIELRSKLDVLPTAAAPERGETAVPTVARPAPREASEAEPIHDDLQRIRGIGPVLERTLHGLGIHHYAQIARWTPQDVQAMSERLPGFHNRIRRDRWTAAARRLHIAKYGTPP